MMQAQPVSDDVITTLAQADVLLLLAELFSPPWLCDDDWSCIRREATALLDAAGLGDEALTLLLDKTLEAAQATDRGDWSDEFTGLFEGSMPCPTSETAYIRRDKGAILADIAGFHHAFGFDTRPEAGEKADHLVCELEFEAMLLTMAATARRDGSTRHAEIAEQAAGKFAADHLGQWIVIAAERMMSLTSLTVYQRLAELTQGVWAAMVEQRGWDIETSAAQMPEDQTASPYECGMAPEQTTVPLQVRGRHADPPQGW